MTGRLPDRPPDPAYRFEPLREVIARHGLAARHSLGQHFLLDLNLTRRIVRAAGEFGGDLTGATVIEIGPGPGGLTRALLESDAREVIAIERDARCVAALEPLVAAYPDRLRVISADARKIDAAALGSAPRRIVANLPYNLATVLLLGWLKQANAFAGFTLMFQKEVAARLVAKPGTREYGRLSVMAQWLCESRALFDLPARAFVPPPKVVSTVVELTPRPAPLAPAEADRLERVTAAAFGQRRKMLRSALRGLTPDPAALLGEAGVAGTARAETLDVAQFCALARAFARASKQSPA